MSTFPVSQLASQDSHDPLLLCCCFVLRDCITAGEEMQSHGFHLRYGKKKNQNNINSTVFPSLFVKQTSGSTVSFGVDRRKCGRARGAEWALSIESTFLKAAEPCDFSSLSQGLGYSVCLCELMLWRAQCLSNPAEHRYIIGSCREDKWSSLAQMTEHPVVLTPFFQRTYCVSCLNSQVCPHTEHFWT